MHALVSLTFDDGFRCQFEKALPVLNGYGMPATFFLIANQDSTHDRWLGHTNDWWKIDWREDDIAMLKQLARDGHEIGSHGVTHHPAKIREQDQADAEARESKRLIEGWVGATVSSFCYPFYWSHCYLAEAVKNAGYEQARGGGMLPSYGPRASYYAIPDDGSLDRFNVDCRQISDNENVDEWVQPGRWHILTFHGIGGEQDGWAPVAVDRFAAQMAELARHRDLGAVEVVTFQDGAARFRSH
ncbi:MAG: polysaccharide deacetylase family protein [Terriglobales bacterium]|jgi:peptidoglycan/xylan/chitin deacetylase (PgdA/CDA1 family)